MLPKWPNDGSSHKTFCAPPEMQTLALGADPSRFRVPQLQGQKWRLKRCKKSSRTHGLFGEEPGKQIHKEDGADARSPLAGHQDLVDGQGRATQRKNRVASRDRYMESEAASNRRVSLPTVSRRREVLDVGSALPILVVRPVRTSRVRNDASALPLTTTPCGLEGAQERHQVTFFLSVEPELLNDVEEFHRVFQREAAAVVQIRHLVVHVQGRGMATGALAFAREDLLPAKFRLRGPLLD